MFRITLMKRKNSLVITANAANRNYFLLVTQIQTIFVNNSTNPEDFLKCSNCKRYFHAQCNEPPLNKTIVNSSIFCTKFH